MTEQSDIAKEFGRRLRELRLHRGLTQEQLAERAGLDRTYIGDAELGKRNPTLLSMDKLARALDAEVVVLLSDEGLSETMRAV